MIQRFSMIAGMLALAATVLGQTQSPTNTQNLRDRDPDLDASKQLASELQQANIHSGPFYLLSRIRIGDVGYSEEFYLPTSDQQGGLNLSVEAPQRLYFVPHKKTIFTAQFVPGYAFFRAGQRKNQFNYSARADAHFLFNYLYLDIYGARADQLRAEVADVNRLATQKESEEGIAGEWKYSSRTSTVFSARYRDITFPESRYQPEFPLQRLDRTEKNGRVSFFHKTFPLTSLFVAGEASDYSFKREPSKDSSRRYVGAGFLRNAGRTRFRVEAGPTSLKFDDPTQREFSGVTGKVDLSRASGRWITIAGLTRDLGFAIFAGNNYYVSNGARIGVDYAATRHLTLRANSAYERDNFDVPVGGVRRRDNISFSSIGFLYSIGRLRWGVDAGWFERDSNFTEDDSGIRWVLHLSFTP